MLTKIKSLCNKVWIKIEPRCHPIWKAFQSKVEAAFALSEHSAIQAPRVIMRVTIALLAVLFLWAAFFHIDQVVNAQGQVIANSRTQIVQAADGGVLVDMKVEEGDQVEQGQVIATLEKDRAFSAFTENSGKVSA